MFAVFSLAPVTKSAGTKDGTVDTSNTLTMKQLLLLAASLVLLSGACRKNRPKNSLGQLPAETQTGANTFGCLIDGRPFIPSGDPFGGPIKKAAYQFNNGGYYLGISGKRQESEGVISIAIFSDSTQPLAVHAYDLTTHNENGRYSGVVNKTANAILNSYYTNEINRGQLIIKKFDEINQIISGTFWFDAKNSNGQIVQIREGRFDLHYIR